MDSDGGVTLNQDVSGLDCTSYTTVQKGKAMNDFKINSFGYLLESAW